MMTEAETGVISFEEEEGVTSQGIQAANGS